MMFPPSQNRIGKVCALVAATLILPVLAYAQQQGQQGQQGQNPPRAPEVNTAWVLVPFLGGVLLYSWRRLSKAKA